MGMSTSIVAGSIAAVAKGSSFSIAEAFLGADIIALVDVSGSMSARDSRGGRSRYEVACDELAKLQQANPGAIAVVAFSHCVEFAPSGVPPFLNGRTNLAEALRFVSVADGTVRFIVISDGQPDDPDAALRVAKSFTSPLDCVYVGPESERSGADFLQRLANVHGGRYAVASKAAELASTVQKLLKAG
jgi:Mg-chelatase subunit ChlD